MLRDTSFLTFECAGMTKVIAPSKSSNIFRMKAVIRRLSIIKIYMCQKVIAPSESSNIFRMKAIIRKVIDN